MVTAMRVLFMLGLIVYLWPFIVAAFFIAVAWVAAWLVRERRRQAADARRKARAALIARADEQQAGRLAGDPRGWYGDYPPAM